MAITRILLGAVTVGAVAGVTTALTKLLLDRYLPYQAYITDELIYEGKSRD